MVVLVYEAHTSIPRSFTESNPLTGLMDTKLNGYTNGQATVLPSRDTNGHVTANDVLIHGLDGEPSIEELERELPGVGDGQLEMREVLSRMVQSIYAELTEMADTYVFYHYLYTKLA